MLEEDAPPSASAPLYPNPPVEELHPNPRAYYFRRNNSADSSCDSTAAATAVDTPMEHAAQHAAEIPAASDPSAPRVDASPARTPSARSHASTQPAKSTSKAARTASAHTTTTRRPGPPGGPCPFGNLDWSEEDAQPETVPLPTEEEEVKEVPRACKRCGQTHFCEKCQENATPILCRRRGSAYENRYVVSCRNRYPSAANNTMEYCNGLPFAECAPPEGPQPCERCGHEFYAHGRNVRSEQRVAAGVRKWVHSCRQRTPTGEYCNCIPFTICVQGLEKSSEGAVPRACKRAKQ